MFSPQKKLPLLRPPSCRHHLARAFTLIELLTVIAVLAVLASILMVSMGNVRNSTETTKCASNMRQIGVATLLYANDHNNMLPPFWAAGSMVWNDRLNEYLDVEPWPKARYLESPVWVCPSATIIDNSMFNRHYGLSTYARQAPWSMRINAVPSPARTILIGELNENHESVAPLKAGFTTRGDVKTRYRMSHKDGTGSNYLFVDGHVEFREGRLTDMNGATSPWKWW